MRSYVFPLYALLIGIQLFPAPADQQDDGPTTGSQNGQHDQIKHTHISFVHLVRGQYNSIPMNVPLAFHA